MVASVDVGVGDDCQNVSLTGGEPPCVASSRRNSPARSRVLVYSYRLVDVLIVRIRPVNRKQETLNND